MYNVCEGRKYAKPGFRNGYRTTVRELTGKQDPGNTTNHIDTEQEELNMKKYNVFKISKNGEELLETVKAADIKEAQKAMVKKYMSIVLSTQTQLAVRAA